MDTFPFYVFALVTVASSLVVITHRQITYAVLALAVAMLALSAVFVLLEAYFLAVIQILIYAGAILVLFLFVIMLLGTSGTDSAREAQNIRKWAKITLVLALLSEIAIAFYRLKEMAFTPIHLRGTVEAIGEALFTDYLLPFELVSGILLIGIFGVVNLVQRELRK